MRLLQSSFTFSWYLKHKHTYTDSMDTSLHYFLCYIYTEIMRLEWDSEFWVCCFFCTSVCQAKSWSRSNANKWKCAEESHKAPQGRGLCVSVTHGSFSSMSKGQVHNCSPDVVAWPHDLIYSLKTGSRTLLHVCIFLPHRSANISTALAQRYPCVKCLSENSSWPMTHREQIYCQAALHLGKELPPWSKNRLRHSQSFKQTTCLAGKIRGSLSSLSGTPVHHPFNLIGVFDFFIRCCRWPLHESVEQGFLWHGLWWEGFSQYHPKCP